MPTAQTISHIPSTAAPAPQYPYQERRRRPRIVGLSRETLYQEFQPLVRRLIRQYGDTPEMRQDLAGEIFYRFCAILDAFEPSRGIPLRPYIVRQLTASVYTYARHGWRRRTREISLDLGEGMFEPVHKEDPSREWDERLAMEQVLHHLPDAISKLPKRGMRNIPMMISYGR